MNKAGKTTSDLEFSINNINHYFASIADLFPPRTQTTTMPSKPSSLLIPSGSFKVRKISCNDLLGVCKGMKDKNKRTHDPLGISNIMIKNILHIAYIIQTIANLFSAIIIDCDVPTTPKNLQNRSNTKRACATNPVGVQANISSFSNCLHAGKSSV